MTSRITEILPVLEAIAPLALAEDWDNVGLLLEPTENAEVFAILLTIDLTESVLAEAISAGATLVVAYHPPIFKGPRRLTQRTASERIVVDALRAGIFVYSPHTALDAAPGGINDWLSRLLGPGNGHPVVPHPRFEGLGAGRVVELDSPMSIESALERLKDGLGLSHLRVAASHKHQEGAPIKRFAVCAGAGGSVFERLPHADLFLTGEMRHHDILARVSDGMSVVVTDHTNTERGYLPRLQSLLEQHLPDVRVQLSRFDADPLRIR